LPAYEHQQSDEQPAQPIVPLPPQSTTPPAADAPQASTRTVPDKYGFVDMTAGEEEPTTISFGQ
jgi:hypothetical protein